MFTSDGGLFGQSNIDFQDIRSRRRRADDVAQGDNLAWTTARCMRLLRTISSRISILRTLLDSQRGINNSKSIQHSNGQRKKTSNAKTKIADLAWDPDDKPKVYRKTYGKKSLIRANKDTETSTRRSKAAVSSFPSPFVRRLRGCLDKTAISERPEAACPLIQRRSRQLPVQPNSGIETAENSLENACVSVLKITAPPVPEPETGVRSLASMCRRKLAANMDFETDNGGPGTGGDGQSCFELYDYLQEELSTVKDSGWWGLREVVRAHAVQLVCDAYEDGLLSESLIERLIGICNSSAAVLESQAIMTTWIRVNELPITRKIDPLDKFCSRSSSTSFFFRTIGEILRTHPNALSKLGQHPLLWKRLGTSIVLDGNDEAVACLQSIFTASCTLLENDRRLGRPDAQYLTRWTTLGTSIGAMAIASRFAPSPDAALSELPGMIHCMSAEALLAALGQPELGLSWKVTTEIAAPYLASSLVLLAIPGSHTHVAHTPGSELLAHALERWSKSSLGRDHAFQHTAQTLAAHVAQLDEGLDFGIGESLSGRLLSSRHAALREIAAEIATAMHHGRPAHDSRLETNIDAVVGEGGATPSGVAARFRWDDGLCEWIAATPIRPSPAPCVGSNKSLGAASTNLPPLTPVAKTSVIDSSSTEEPSPDLLALTPMVFSGPARSRSLRSPPMKRRRVRFAEESIAKVRMSKVTSRPGVGALDDLPQSKRLRRQMPVEDKENHYFIPESSDDELGM